MPTSERDGRTTTTVYVLISIFFLEISFVHHGYSDVFELAEEQFKRHIYYLHSGSYKYVLQNDKILFHRIYNVIFYCNSSQVCNLIRGADDYFLVS